MKLSNLIESIRNTLTITKYSILMFFREKTAIFFSLFIPVMLMGIFGALNMGGGVKFNLAVVDEAKNPTSTQVIEVIHKIEAFETTETTDKEGAINSLKNGDFSYVLVLPQDFGSQFTNQVNLEKIPASLGTTQTQINPQKIDLYYDQSQNASTIQVGFTVFDKIFDGLTHQIARVPNYFEVNQISVVGSDLRYIDFIIPGLVAMSVMQLSIFAVTGQIVSWRERGILKR